MLKRIGKRLLDPVLIAAWTLAIISAFFVRPDRKYIGYIDFRSLGILWGLMVIIQGFKENSVFEKIAGFLLAKVKRGWQLGSVLIFLCFFASMFITNDVALITFVPFAMLVLYHCKREDMMIPVIVLQTVAANLGSMLTPIGNPQNLYMFGLTGMSIIEFMNILAPYTMIVFILLAISVFFMPGKSEPLSAEGNFKVIKEFGSRIQIVIYAILFISAFLAVLRLIPWYVMVIAVLVIVAGMDYKILFRADYVLLMTFVGFFVFTGNMGRITAISDFFNNIMSGREFYISIVASQFISNVPATLMLSGFTDNYKELIVGVNVGGLGTLIASMASLISFKIFSVEYASKRGKYFAVFTAVNLIYLIILTVLHGII